MVTKIHDLKPAAGSRQAKRRVARGIGGRRGKTAGRGMKGQGARDTVPAWFEGGQTPVTRRTPKAKGFRNPFRVEYHVVNLDTLAGFDAGSTVDPATLRRRGLVAKRGLVKILGRGDLGGRRLVVKAHASHPGTSELVASVIRDAVLRLEEHEGAFSLLFDEGFAVAERLVRHPLVRAVGFTGSREGGLAVEIRPISREEALGADEMWLSSSTKEILAVNRIDGRPFASGTPGAVFRKMYALFQASKPTASAADT